MLLRAGGDGAETLDDPSCRTPPRSRIESTAGTAQVGRGEAGRPLYVRCRLGLIVGLERDRSAQFSFYIAIPTILAASAIQAVDVLWDGAAMNVGLGSYAVGFVVAAVVGIAALRLVLAALYRARFRYFAYYVWGSPS